MTYDNVVSITLEHANDESAMIYANMLCQVEYETSTQTIAHSRHIGSTDDFDVYYCYGADHHFFTEKE